MKALFKDQPAEIHLAARRLLASRNDVAGRHRRTRRHEPDCFQRCPGQPVSGVETRCRENKRHLTPGELQRMEAELAGNVEWRVADDVVVPLIMAGEKIMRRARTIPSALNEIGAVCVMPSFEAFNDNRAKAAARIVDAASKSLLGNQTRAAPAWFNVVLVGFALPDMRVEWLMDGVPPLSVLRCHLRLHSRANAENARFKRMTMGMDDSTGVMHPLALSQRNSL